jgi:hypothetical protein
MAFKHWTEILRCPSCALTGVAFLYQQPSGMVVIDTLPVGFERVTSNYGDTFYCSACGRPAREDTK